MENVKHSIKVVARTHEVANEYAQSRNKELKIFSGRAAGVCYMGDDYFSERMQDDNKAYTRQQGNTNSGHNSVFEHGHISLLIESNKMILMILNSLGVYTTSEKSSRYVRMNPDTQEELDLYNKWIEKIQKLILDKYPDTDDAFLNKNFNKAFPNYAQIIKDGKLAEIDDTNKQKITDWLVEQGKEVNAPSYKLAQENARYMLSVFTPTVMVYTVSFGQLFLIRDFFIKLNKDLGLCDDTFSKALKPHVEAFLEELNKVTDFDNLIKNVKQQYIRFLEMQHKSLYKGYWEKSRSFEYIPDTVLSDTKKTVIGDSYTINYNGSLAMLAQAQRHRTIRYTMKLKEPGENGWYIPEIVKYGGEDVIHEWLRDMQSISYCVPQGTLVNITEQGLFEDFIMKCKERLCGRAQLETMLRTKETMQLFIDNKDNLCELNKMLLRLSTLDDKPVARCKFADFECPEGCRWGASEALTRII